MQSSEVSVIYTSEHKFLRSFPHDIALKSEDLYVSNAIVKSIIRDDNKELITHAKRLIVKSDGGDRGSTCQPFDRSVLSKLLHLCCEYDSANCAALLLNGEFCAVVPLVNETDGETGKSPLHTAADNHSSRCIELLLRKRARTDLKTKDGFSQLALQRSLQCGRMDVPWNPAQSLDHLLILLSEKDLTTIRLLSEKTKEIGEVAYAIASEGLVVQLAALLMVAAEKVNAAILDARTEADLRLKEKKTVYDCVIKEALSPSRLSWNENEERRKLLLCSIELLHFFGAIPGPRTADSKSTSPLLLASKAGDVDVMKLLLGTNFDVNEADDEGNSALHWSLKVCKGRSSQHIKILLLLLKNGARVSQKNKLGLTAVHIAAGNGNLQALEILLAKEPDSVHITSALKETPLFLAAKNDCIDCVQLLLRFGASTEVLNLRRERPIDLSKSQDMRSALSHTYVVITNRTCQQKYTACVDKDGVVLESCEMLLEDGLGTTDRSCTSTKSEVCKYFKSPSGCIRGAKCFYKHGELDPQISKLREWAAYSANMEDWGRKIFVGGLPATLDSDLLGRLLEDQFGPIQDANVIKTETEGHAHSRCFGFVTFKSESSANAATEAHYIIICGKQVEIKSFLPKYLLVQELHDVQAQQENNQLEYCTSQPPSPSHSNQVINKETPEPMSWVSRLVQGRPRACSSDPKSPPSSISEDKDMPKWFQKLKKWLPLFLKKMENNSGGQFYALSSLKSDFKAICGMELDHSSLGYSKLSDFVKSLPELCHVRIIHTGGSTPNHMVLLPSIRCSTIKIPPRKDTRALSSVSDHDLSYSGSGVHKLLPDISRPCSDDSCTQGDESEEDQCSHKIHKERTGVDYSTTVNPSFLEFLKPDVVFLGRTWLGTGGFKTLDEYEERHLVLEALAWKRKEVVFLRSFSFFNDYKASIEQGSCFACKKNKMLWANYPCQHLLWCGGCKLIATKVAAVGTMAHKCVVCDNVVEKIDRLPWIMTREQLYNEIKAEEFPPIELAYLRSPNKKRESLACHCHWSEICIFESGGTCTK